MAAEPVMVPVFVVGLAQLPKAMVFRSATERRPGKFH